MEAPNDARAEGEALKRVKNRLQFRIEKALRPLIGLPLSDMWRAGFQIFEFGPQHPFLNNKGKEARRGDYSLHVECPWRIIAPDGGMAVGSWDYGSDDKRRHPRHARNRAFFDRLHAETLCVESLETDTVGSVRFRLQGGYLLEIMPVSSLRNEDFWRLLASEEDPQFVVTSAGAYTSKDDVDSD